MCHPRPYHAGGPVGSTYPEASGWLLPLVGRDRDAFPADSIRGFLRQLFRPNHLMYNGASLATAAEISQGVGDWMR